MRSSPRETDFRVGKQRLRIGGGTRFRPGPSAATSQETPRRLTFIRSEERALGTGTFAGQLKLIYFEI